MECSSLEVVRGIRGTRFPRADNALDDRAWDHLPVVDREKWLELSIGCVINYRFGMGRMRIVPY